MFIVTFIVIIYEFGLFFLDSRPKTSFFRSPLRRVANFRPILALNMRPRLYRSGHLAAASPEDL